MPLWRYGDMAISFATHARARAARQPLPKPGTTSKPMPLAGSVQPTAILSPWRMIGPIGRHEQGRQPGEGENAMIRIGSELDEVFESQ